MELSVFFDHIREGAAQQGISLEQAMERVRRTGISCVELDAATLAPEDSMCERLAHSGLRASCLYSFFDFAHAKQEAQALELVEKAAFMGARYVLAVPGFLQPEDDQAACLARMDESLRRLCAAADKRGLTVLMEDFDSDAAPYATAVQLRRFMDTVPGLACAFDTGNFLCAGEDVLCAFPLLEGHIQYVHLKDRALTPRPGEEGKRLSTGQILYSASVGGGAIPMDRCLRRLRATGYDGVLAIEHFGSPDQLSDIERSAAFVLAHWQ